MAKYLTSLLTALTMTTVVSITGWVNSNSNQTQDVEEQKLLPLQSKDFLQYELNDEYPVLEFSLPKLTNLFRTVNDMHKKEGTPIVSYGIPKWTIINDDGNFDIFSQDSKITETLIDLLNLDDIEINPAIVFLTTINQDKMTISMEYTIAGQRNALKLFELPDMPRKQNNLNITYDFSLDV